MDSFYLWLGGGFVLIILATIWNMFMAPKKKKDPDKMFQHFVDKYGFTTNSDATMCAGVFANRNVQIVKKPLTATIQVPNPRAIHMLVEQGVESGITDLIETPIDGAEGLTIKSNYPEIASQVLDDNIVGQLKEIPVFSMLLRDGLQLRFPDFKDPKEIEHLLQIAANIANAIETVNYAYG